MPSPLPATVRLFRIATVFTVLAVAMGSVVCATDSGFECSTWPGCYPDRFAPGSDDVTAWLYRNPIIEFVHRTSAIVCGPLVLRLGFAASIRREARWRALRPHHSPHHG